MSVACGSWSEVVEAVQLFGGTYEAVSGDAWEGWADVARAVHGAQRLAWFLTYRDEAGPDPDLWDSSGEAAKTPERMEACAVARPSVAEASRALDLLGVQLYNCVSNGGTNCLPEPYATSLHDAVERVREWVEQVTRPGPGVVSVVDLAKRGLL